MKTDALIKYAIIAGIIGAVIAVLGLIAGGRGDHPEAYQVYLVASAIVFGSALICIEGQKIVVLIMGVHYA